MLRNAVCYPNVHRSIDLEALRPAEILLITLSVSLIYTAPEVAKMSYKCEAFEIVEDRFIYGMKLEISHFQLYRKKLNRHLGLSLFIKILPFMEQIETVADLIKKLTSDLDKNQHLLISCIIVVTFNIIVAGINLWMQFKLKDREKKINGYNLREAIRIQKQEELYRFLDELRYFSNSTSTEATEYLNKIFSINRYVTANGLYLNKKIVLKTTEITDYFQVVIADYIKKNVSKEGELFKNYVDEFNS